MHLPLSLPSCAAALSILVTVVSAEPYAPGYEHDADAVGLQTHNVRRILLEREARPHLSYLEELMQDRDAVRAKYRNHPLVAARPVSNAYAQTHDPIGDVLNTIEDKVHTWKNKGPHLAATQPHYEQQQPESKHAFPKPDEKSEHKPKEENSNPNNKYEEKPKPEHPKLDDKPEYKPEYTRDPKPHKPEPTPEYTPASRPQKPEPKPEYTGEPKPHKPEPTPEYTREPKPAYTPEAKPHKPEYKPEPEEPYPEQERKEPEYKPEPKPKKPTYKPKPKKPKGPIAVDAGDDPFDFIGSVEIGTPPQKFKFRFDTGTQLSWVKEAVYDGDSDGYSHKTPTPVSGFDPRKSRTWRSSETTGADDNYGYGKTSAKVKEGTDKVTVGGVTATITLKLRDQAEIDSQDKVDGHFGLSLRTADVPEPWLYQAVQSGQCDPIFALTPAPRIAPETKYDPPSAAGNYSRRNYEEESYSKPKPKPKPAKAQLSICGYDGAIPSQLNQITQSGQNLGLWQIQFQKLTVGSSIVPLVAKASNPVDSYEEPSDTYGEASGSYAKRSDSYEKRDDSYEKVDESIDAVVDSGSPFILLPKVAADKVHKIIGAICPGEQETYAPPEEDYGYENPDTYENGYEESYKDTNYDSEYDSYDYDEEDGGYEYEDYGNYKRGDLHTRSPKTNESPSGFFGSRNGVVKHDLCTVPCSNVHKLPNITFTFSTGDHHLVPKAYIQRGPDEHGVEKCFSAFSTFDFETDEGKAVKTHAKDQGERLAVLGTAFTQMYSSIFYLGDVGGGQHNMLARRQSQNISLGPIPGFMFVMNDNLSWA
ncbi:aspartic peptidase domain-containing protein [Powellomyces hirtus]|nr:aspartic peptidase domain-containing protein [Powellomyces hirtus]